MIKEKYAWTGLGVPLAWLAELDNVPAPNALADALGDRYLYARNPIFAAIRDAALDHGYRFSAEDTPLWRDYQSLGLMALHRILLGKIIPYFNTATSFERLVDANPAARLPPGFIAGNMKRNVAFHESAHCVAYSLMQKPEADLRAIAPDPRDRVLLESILAESFANTVEVLGSIQQHLPISDSVFYPLNAYFSPNQKRRELLNRAAAEVGAEKRFTLLFLAHFEANLAMQPPTDATYERIAEAGQCVSGQTALAREISDTGFRLNAGFRESTTPSYFELLGYTREYNSLVNAGWLGQAQNQQFARGLAQLFWQTAGKV